MAKQPAHCFLAYNGEDKPAVEALARRLKKEGIEPWFDAWNLIPGRPWQPAIEDALATCGACAVFIGPSGLGPWQIEEMRAAIQRRIGSSAFPVIPVLLPGASREPRSRLPAFLVNVTWVEFRDTLKDAKAFKSLVCGIRGMSPGPTRVRASYRGECPYLGLRTFREKDAPFFFGREARTEWLLDKIRPTKSTATENRFLAVIGASGSGKSSLVRAGLIPQVRAGRLPGSDKWPILVLRPGHNPLESLATALAADAIVGKVVPDEVTVMRRLGEDPQCLHLLVGHALEAAEPDQRVMIVVDQLEEVFTLCEDEERRRAFLHNLLHAASIRHGRTVVVITMRADFYGKCAVYDKLAEALSEQQELVSPMSEDELKKAINGPAQLIGHEIEPALTERLVAHMHGRAGTLPLLQHALAELWNRRSGTKLTLAAYRDLGSLEGALEKHAENVFGELSKDEQDICQRILLRLTQPGEGTEDTRRRASRAELGNSDAAKRVLTKLIDARLVTTEGSDGRQEPGYVEISHEALIRGWSRLRGWIESSRDRLKVQHRLTAAAQEWSDHRAEPNAEDYLYRGARLAEIEEQSASHDIEMNDLEAAFLAASIALREREEGERERRNQELKRALEEAREHLTRIHAIHGVNERDLNNNLLKATHYFAQAAEQAVDTATERNWRIAAEYLAGHGALRGIMAHEESVEGAKFSPDQVRVLTWSKDGTARLWNARTGQPLTPPLRHEGPVSGAALSKDERRVLTWSEDGTARLWNARTGQPLTSSPLQHEGAVLGAALSPLQTRVLTWSEDGTARLWDAQTGHALTPWLSHEGAVLGAALSKDERRVLTWSEDGTARLWNARTGQPLTSSLLQHEGAVLGAALSKDEGRVLTWSEDGTARLWDAQTGQPLTPLLQHERAVWEAALSPGQTRVLTWSEDGTARLWDAQTGKLLTPPLQHEGPVSGAALSKDEARVLTWSADKTARVWDAQTGKALTAPLQHGSPVRGAELSQDQTRVLTWSSDKTARLWDASTGEALTPPLQHESPVRGAKLSQDQTRVLTWSFDGTARLWDAQTGQPLTRPLQHKDAVRGAELSQDETRVLTWSSDGTARLWDASTGQFLTPPLQHESPVRGGELSSARVLTWSRDEARLWDASTGRPLTSPLQHQGFLEGAALSEDRRCVLTWGRDEARLWDARTGQQLLSRPLKHSSAVIGAKLSRDQTRVLTWGRDGTTRLWDARTGQQLLSRPLRHSSAVLGAKLSQAETRVLTWSSDGTARLWDAQTGQEVFTSPLQHKDAVKGAELSRDEKRVLTWSEDGTARLWDAGTGRWLISPLRHEDPVEGAKFSKGEGLVLTWSRDVVRLWDASTGKLAAPLLQHKEVVRGAELSRDEKRVLTWSEDRTARLWDASTGKALTPPLQHQEIVIGAKFSEDQGRVLTWSEDGTARLWEVWTGLPLTPELHHNGPVEGAEWSQDQARVLTWSDDGTARLWHLEPDAAWPKEHLAFRYEVITGTRVSLARDLEFIPADEWYALKQRYDEIARSLRATPAPHAP